MQKRIKKYYVFIILVFLSTIIVPITFSKYKSILNIPLSLNIRKPIYVVEFSPNFNNLPYGYVELEYIQSTGEELIDLDIVPDKELKVEMTMMPLESTQYMYFGTSEYRLLYDEGNLRFNILNESASYESSILNQKLKLNLENFKISINDLDVATHATASVEPDQSENMYLFGGYVNSVARYSRMRLYSLKIWDNSVLVRNFVPCYRTSDGKAGLYDLASSEFYVADNNKNFIKGINSQNISYGTSTNLMANTYSLPGYTLSNWNTNAAGSGTSYNNGESVLNLSSTEGDVINLFANWTEADYTITFDVTDGYAWTSGTCTLATGGTLNGDSCTKQVTYNQTYGVMPTPTKMYYNFLGWFTEESDGVQVTDLSTVDITSDTTLYAHWEEIQNIINGINYGHKTDLTVEPGDDISIGTEKFMVMTNNNGSILAMPYYNLYILGNPSIIKQATEENAGTTPAGVAGTVEFSSEPYWTAGVDVINMSDSRNYVQPYITAYSTTLTNLGATGFTVRAARYSELSALPLVMSNPSGIGYYWIGSSYDTDLVQVRSKNGLARNYYYLTSYGVRPVLVIN